MEWSGGGGGMLGSLKINCMNLIYHITGVMCEEVERNSE